MNKTISSVSALIALSAATASAEIRAAPFFNIGLDRTTNYSAYVDMNGDSTDDFGVWRNSSTDFLAGEFDNEVVVEDLVSYQTKRFAFGADIGSSETTDYSSRWTNWVGLGRSYAGVKLVVGGETNWGWIELNSLDSSTGMVIRGAWETVPDKSITAGAWPGSVIPSNGPYAGGNTVIITNSNFGTITNVTVGGVAAAIQNSGTNWVRITMPATGAPGVKDIVIQTDNGDLLLAGAYTVNPAGEISGEGAEDWTRWREVAGLPVAVNGLAAGVLNGSLYAVGGSDGAARTNVYRFDGTNWTEVAGLPAVRVHLAAGVLNGALYAVGGDDDGSVKTNVYRYNGTNWTEVAGLPAPHRLFGEGVLEGALYAVGGDSSGDRTNVYRYNGTSWTEVAGLPVPRVSLAVGVLNGALYAIGGHAGGMTVRTNVYRYNGTNWMEVAGLPAARSYLTAGVLNGALYAMGGTDASVARTNMYRFDGTNWTEVAGLPTGRLLHASAVLNGALYAVAGDNGGGPKTNVYRYPGGSGVSPSSGSRSGGYQVIITGTNLCDGSDITNVTLCGASVASIVSQSPTQVVVVAGRADAAGLGDVRVFSTSFGETVKSNAFEYVKTTAGILDFDGDGITDIGVYRASDNMWRGFLSTQGEFSPFWYGIAGDIHIPADYDGDGLCDVAIFRPMTATWRIFGSETGQWRPLVYGLPSDRPIPADYDGDGKADFAVLRPATMTWYIFGSSAGPIAPFVYGAPGDRPVPADYDGDGLADPAVVRPSTMTWYIFGTSVGPIKPVVFGAPGDIPVPGDYDGDGRMDYAVFRPSNVTWYIFGTTAGPIAPFQYGTYGDVPLLFPW